MMAQIGFDLSDIDEWIALDGSRFRLSVDSASIKEFLQQEFTMVMARAGLSRRFPGSADAPLGWRKYRFKLVAPPSTSAFLATSLARSKINKQ